MNSQNIENQVTGTTTQASTWESTPQEIPGKAAFDQEHNYVPSGISVEINLPIVYTGSEFIFALNLDGFIPNCSYYPAAVKTRLQKNLFPIQTPPGVAESGLIVVKWTESTIPAITSYLSNRMLTGSIGTGIRLTSNTTQPGQIVVSHFAGVQRKYDWKATTALYSGLEFYNTSIRTSTTTPKTFTYGDVSMQRHISIMSPITKAHDEYDLAFKKSVLIQSTTPTDEMIFSEQFAEDWLVFGIANNLPATETNQLQLDFLFDYSNVVFTMPLLLQISIGTNAYTNITGKYYLPPTDEEIDLDYSKLERMGITYYDPLAMVEHKNIYTNAGPKPGNAIKR